MRVRNPCHHHERLRTESPIAPDGAMATPSAAITPYCKAGCVDPDPSPSSPGVHLGFAVSPLDCLSGDYADNDQDGLGDYCEERLAAAFAPVLRYHHSDDLRRQPYWAVRHLDADTVRIAYALSYYLDLGVVSAAYSECVAASIFGLLAECGGHSGDSETIAFDVYFVPSTQHWVLGRARYSYHGKFNLYQRPSGAAYPTQLTYVQRAGATPIAWVARGKHANYRNQAECDAGNGGGDVINWAFSFDDCTANNSFVTLEAWGSRNLGSNLVRLVDCVASNDPYMQSPVRPPECYWSNDRFYGWQLDRSTSAEGYGTILRNLGF